MKHALLALASATALAHAACGANGNRTSGTLPEPPTAATADRKGTMKIRLKVRDKVVTATLNDSKTSQDFVSLLPLTLAMNDLFGREKFARLPKALSEEGKRTHTYETGEIVYWSPGPDVAIYYRHDGEKIPDPGIIVVGKIDSGVEAFNVPGSIKVTVALIK